MGSRIHLGVAGPVDTYTAKYLQWGQHPRLYIPLLRDIWQIPLSRDTAAMATALLAHGTAHEPLRRGDLSESTGDLHWLYLLHPVREAVEVHAATSTRRWRLFSRHLLQTGDNDLFRFDGQQIVCTGCASVNKAEFTTDPPAGRDALTSIRCLTCGRAEVSSREFRTTRSPEMAKTVPADASYGFAQVRMPAPAFTRGQRIVLLHTDDPYTKLVPGSRGTVTRHDDPSTVHIAWDDGSRLAMCLDGGDQIAPVVAAADTAAAGAEPPGPDSSGLDGVGQTSDGVGQ